MAANIILGVRILPNQFQRIKLDNINLDDKVEVLRNEAAQKINVNKQNIELIYCGIILEDDLSLASCGVKPGVTVHVLEKKTPPAATPTKPLTEADVQNLVGAFKMFAHSPGYRSSLQRLSRPEVLESIIITTPAIVEDPAAVAMIRDPELVVQLSDPDTVRKVAELHPTVIEAARHIATHVHDDVGTTHQNQASTSSGYSYSLDALSEDEDMESPSDFPHEPQPLTRNSSYNAITAAQLAAAIANATNATFGLSTSPADPLSSTPTTSSNVITTEMFNNAIQQAFANSQPVGSNSTNNFTSPVTPTRSLFETFEAMTRRLQPQLQQMREIGLTNNAVNIRALQTTSGDVQAAIELVLSGVFD